MPPFSAKPLKSSAISSTIRRQPFLSFGLPFITIIVLASFGLSSFTQTRYDLRDSKVSAVTKEEELGMKKGRRKFDVREEYHRLLNADRGDLLGSGDGWENKRVQRLPGQDEWGTLPISKKPDSSVE
ncbi:hypothetical protein MVLG_04499 [Microbotryum lychnidis-dioicae p1A1 Lamole]|uniref:Cytochrome c oxidase assembly protein COX16, mitochondrial n=1 Tax=Microbotryum lychnidis-dioicae (strain p1A1 Lamole / MvSl-1064) TaxID=683840 RepID=U5HBE8_USTV1|nr:hypothetical protein MVLG_04499 [Microbotryum lychnidis-dioicae p1A1 Lamole]|eukprot:KDE05058.1 hypothetical protein MVLG_04499 [Microbotryum lychnidis-dioicae p1A1 Lamole]